MDALLLVDVQNDFLPGGALAVPEGDKIIPVLNRISKKFPLVVATQDWHPQDHGSFASNHPGKNEFEQTQLGGLDQILWPDHCVQGQKGADFSSELEMHLVEAIFRKGTDTGIDSYSGFFDNGKKKSTGLGDYLKGRGVTRVFIGGLAADFCVGFTTLDSLGLGFDTNLIEDATRPIDKKGWENMKKTVLKNGGKIILSEEISE
ncbi:MAG: bifunctional nicotinamidase/pyrazinamidase [Bacteroidetes bacterium]|nr:MAG: bifunctional nicotinamidase/pyrazinamidase [Bacteroidota bacterium]